MDLSFEATVFEWRGPAPFHFVAVPDDEASLIAEVAPAVTYGWGMVPVDVALGQTTLHTSLWPKDGGYVVPLKNALRIPEGVEVGDVVRITLHIDV